MKNPRRKRTGYLSEKNQFVYNFDSRRKAAGYWTLDRNKKVPRPSKTISPRPTIAGTHS
jgi:hypothetical protein